MCQYLVPAMRRIAYGHTSQRRYKPLDGVPASETRNFGVSVVSRCVLAFLKSLEETTDAASGALNDFVSLDSRPVAVESASMVFYFFMRSAFPISIDAFLITPF